MSDLLTGAEPTDYDASSIEVLEGLEPVRKRPGMYIGGTDERALHHLVAEVLDNSMDEAVAGHASRIEVELLSDYSMVSKDNGRGIPIDPHPKFPDKSALEVILCTLHAGGKFSGDAYETSGGLHGVGASVVNALSDSMVVQVARNKELYEQRFSRGIPLGPVEKVGAAPNRRGTTVTFHADEQIFGSHRFKPARLFKSIRSKAYLFSGVEIRWKSEIDDGETPTTATFHFPGGLADYLTESLGSASTYADKPFAGVVDFKEKFNAPGKVEWAINWTPRAMASSSPIVTPSPRPRAAPMRRAFGPRSSKASARTASLSNNKKASIHHRDDLVTGGCALVSCFIREPEFVGQTKDRLATVEAQNSLKARCAITLTTGWRRIRNPQARSSIFWCCAPRNACAAVRKKRPRASQRRRNCACPASSSIAPIQPRGHRAVHRRGRFSGGQRQDGAQPQNAGAFAAQG